MNYEQAIKYIEGTAKFGMKLGLDSTRELLGRLGNPQDDLKFIHVAGTNGKGSVCAFLTSILMSSGYRVGTFTSPYLVEFNERFRVNDRNIPNDTLAEIVEDVSIKIDEMIDEGYDSPTEFEIETAVAFVYFKRAAVDVVVLEVGLGGRYDSTNVIENPLVEVITSISLDHTGVLGDTIAKIAYEKAGIIKKDSDVVVYPQVDEAMEVIRRVSDENNARIIDVDADSIELIDRAVNKQVFSLKSSAGRRYDRLQISLNGAHQLKNCATAITAAEFISSEMNKITEESIIEGVGLAKWPGRVQMIDGYFGEGRDLLIDGAHNLKGARALSTELDFLFKEREYSRRTLFIGMLKDKDVDGCLNELIGGFNSFITATPHSPRAMEAKELAEKIELLARERGIEVESISTVDDVGEIKDKNPGDLTVACGSLYLVGDLLARGQE